MFSRFKDVIPKSYFAIYYFTIIFHLLFCLAMSFFIILEIPDGFIKKILEIFFFFDCGLIVVISLFRKIVLVK